MGVPDGNQPDLAREMYKDYMFATIFFKSNDYGNLEFQKNPSSQTRSISAFINEAILKNYLVGKFHERLWGEPSCSKYSGELSRTVDDTGFAFFEKDIKLQSFNLNFLYKDLNRNI